LIHYHRKINIKHVLYGFILYFMIYMTENNVQLEELYDGKTWIGLGTGIFPSTQGIYVHWNGSIWTAVGQGANTIAYSYNGINWVGLGNTIFTSNGNHISSNGIITLAVGVGGNTIAYSYDGINWTGLGSSILTNTGLGISWNGSVWVATGSNNSAYSYDGINWSASSAPASYNVASNYGVKPIPFIQHPTLALGSGTTTMAYSPDGIGWTSLGNTTFTVQGYCAFWNGTIWLAGGQGGNTMAYSYDGVQWTPIKNPITTAVTGIAYNGNTWVAVGIGANTVAYSYDTLTWTGISHSFTAGGSIFWNGTVFMITYNASAQNSTFVSTNGISWNMTSAGYLNGIPASNGYTWVSGTNSLSNNLYYANASNPVSVNPWTAATPTIFTTSGNCVCYGGSIWVAGGLGGNTLAYSYDGITWVGLGTTTFPNGCSSICWNGTRFVGAGGNYVGYSKDGITWYSSRALSTSVNYVVSNPGIGAFAPPSAMVLNNNSLTGNGISRSQTLEFVSSDPYFQQGFDNVTIQLNTKYNN